VARLRLAALLTGALVAAVAVAVVADPAGSSAAPGKEHALFSVATRRRVVALSFDDGPDARWTRAVLTMLEAHHDHATFFDVGANALAHRELVEAELTAGEEIGSHTMHHARLPRLPLARIRSEVRQGQEALVAAGAPRPVLFRPPVGLTDERVEDVLEAAHLRMAMWTLCLERFTDHERVDVGVSRMLARVRPGDILLAHDGGIPDRRRTLQALPALLDGLARKGFRVVTVSQLEALRRR
jgi:peptidoglycan/xylan/chitin deacetylase (PgdA/CDA1 family)